MGFAGQFGGGRGDVQRIAFFEIRRKTVGCPTSRVGGRTQQGDDVFGASTVDEDDGSVLAILGEALAQVLKLLVAPHRVRAERDPVGPHHRLEDAERRAGVHIGGGHVHEHGALAAVLPELIVREPELVALDEHGAVGYCLPPSRPWRVALWPSSNLGIFKKPKTTVNRPLRTPSRDNPTNPTHARQRSARDGAQLSCVLQQIRRVRVLTPAADWTATPGTS